MSHHPLFSAQDAKTEAIARAEKNAAPDFLATASTIVLRLASAMPHGFTTDAVWEVLDASGIKTHEPRALGAVMKQLADGGYITKTGAYVDSLRPECHCRPIPIWKKA